ncbi:transcription antitermination factor NusB [Peptoniphilus raoultii]|uniref:transcription antitermination factor NusB n=1 Tax=Peptoniphilus raoultii TaxID=1776387 RepID=UPI0008DB22C4|nr:transcription antitermination factor NusB [Peptoniphilus raoultii]
MSRKKARIGAMQLLYSMEINKEFDAKNIHEFLESYDFLEDEKSYIKDLTEDLLSKLGDIDKILSENLEGWTLERLAKVDREILRIAVYEFLYRDDIPNEVSINEAVAIAKKFSTNDSPKFVNGILASIFKKLKDESN